MNSRKPQSELDLVWHAFLALVATIFFLSSIAFGDGQWTQWELEEQRFEVQQQAETTRRIEVEERERSFEAEEQKSWDSFHERQDRENTQNQLEGF